MARVAVKFGRFKWNRGGYQSVQNGGGVQSLLDSQAQGVASRASSIDGHRYAVERKRGRFANGRKVVSLREKWSGVNARKKSSTLIKARRG